MKAEEAADKGGAMLTVYKAGSPAKVQCVTHAPEVWVKRVKDLEKGVIGAI